MPMFRKKPVVIEARQVPLAPEGAARAIAMIDLAAWCGGSYQKHALGVCIFIDTPEGTMRADPADWIIKGVQGKFYPCKPDIFAATYEAAQE